MHFLAQVGPGHCRSSAVHIMKKLCGIGLHGVNLRAHYLEKVSAGFPPRLWISVPFAPSITQTWMEASGK